MLALKDFATSAWSPSSFSPDHHSLSMAPTDWLDLCLTVSLSYWSGQWERQCPWGLTLQEIQQQEWEVSAPPPGRVSGPGQFWGPCQARVLAEMPEMPIYCLQSPPSPSTTAAAFLAFQAGAPERACENLPCTFLPSSKSWRAWNTDCVRVCVCAQ